MVLRVKRARRRPIENFPFLAKKASTQYLIGQLFCHSISVTYGITKTAEDLCMIHPMCAFKRAFSKITEKENPIVTNINLCSFLIYRVYDCIIAVN